MSSFPIIFINKLFKYYNSLNDIFHFNSFNHPKSVIFLTEIKKLEQIYSGKAKTLYKTNDPTKLISEFRDSLTAFNGGKKSEAPKKGYYNAQISRKIFEMLEENGIKTHYVNMASDVDMVVDVVEIVKLEVIVRNIAAGSITKKYPMPPGKVFERPIVAFDYKSDEYQDPMINEDIAYALDVATFEEMAEIKKTALKINELLKSYFEKNGFLLPDFKLEFGRRGPNKEIVLADEISCDTCRIWDKETKQSLDKDVFRFDKGDPSKTYEIVARKLVPEIFN
ncbi:Phosphoribosylaminoimidazole-succinocarboxamide synthase [Methanolapillus millepedarum]|uniref:Phosphoribosylaminoimidazole-succinocarboxamide synthase n=1 Tax=Methanolapillus millepedarum TaxID=3028296 RepID=A0AA96V3H7_9EURY|nr:Phosphoribosylaminoimidazole-succinocarboxamide synthase [Methanosarcinaceae archaeon Ac7]